MSKHNSKDFNLISSTMAITIAMLLSKILSFVRDMVQANYLGASEISDAILLSTSLLMTLSTFVRSPFQASYLPFATDAYYSEEKSKKEFFGSIYLFAVSVGLVLMVIEFVFMKPILAIVVPGFTDDTRSFLYDLLLIELPVIPLSMIASVNDGNLKVYNKFGISEISNAILAFFLIGYFIIFKSSISILTLGVCVVSSYVCVFILRTLVLRHAGLRVTFKLDWWKRKEILAILKAMVPFILATCAKELNSLIDKAVASLLRAGSITIQSYASKLTITETGLIATAISMVIFSQAAKQFSKGDNAGLKKIIVDGMKFVNTVMIPCCLLTIILKNEIIQVLFGRGEFTAEDVVLTANTMMIYSIGMIGAGFDEVLTRAMHATRHRKFPAIVSTISVFANTLLNFLVYKSFGVYGLAAASSLVSILKAPIYYIYVNRKLVKFDHNDKILQDFGKNLLVCILACAIVIGLKVLFGSMIDNPLVALIIWGVAGVCLCFIGLLFIKNEYAYKIFGKFRNLLKGRKK